MVLDDVAAVVGLDEQGFIARAGELIDGSLAAVLTACLSVEAAVNELFLAYQLGTVANLVGLEAGLAQRLSQAWDAGASKLSALEKADLANVIAGAGSINWGKAPAQQMGLLNSLRNELVHHKPIWVEQGGAPHESTDTLERKLGSEFPTAAIWRTRGVPFRWNGCLGAGCARWACRVADDFNRQIYATLGARFPLPAL